jgi:hypothetical protein
LEVLVDSNVILDVLTNDAAWFAWSSVKLAFEVDKNTLVINPIILSSPGTVNGTETIFPP